MNPTRWVPPKKSQSEKGMERHALNHLKPLCHDAGDDLEERWALPRTICSSVQGANSFILLGEAPAYVEAVWCVGFGNGIQIHAHPVSYHSGVHP